MFILRLCQLQHKFFGQSAVVNVPESIENPHPHFRVTWGTPNASQRTYLGIFCYIFLLKTECTHSVELDKRNLAKPCLGHQDL